MNSLWNPRGSLRRERVGRAPKRARFRRTRAALILAACLGMVSWSLPVAGQSLRGSLGSVKKQDRQAERHDYSYLKNPRQVEKFVRLGLLEKVPGNRNYRLEGPSFPYARPGVKLFIERLSRQYRSACGERLVVTSLTRPKTHQPRNASNYSVHPTGMALDIRRSRKAACRDWLEETLLYLEKRGVLEATYERHPPHYHVAVFPRLYERYVAEKTSGNSLLAYKVRRGDSLWTIARKHKTSVSRLQKINALKGGRIYAGQTLKIPRAK